MLCIVQWKCLYFIDLNVLFERTQNINHVSIRRKRDGEHVLIYTSVMKNPNGDGVLQNQSIAVGDGVTYKKNTE